MGWGGQKFGRAQLIFFLRAIDRNLVGPVTMRVVGGTAASLGYGSRSKTSDVDVTLAFGEGIDSLDLAVVLARQQTGLPVDVNAGAAGIADFPYDYESRLRRLALGMKNLAIIVPDKYDLVLSKANRGQEPDLVSIKSIHREHPLSLTTLLKRHKEYESGAPSLLPMRWGVIAVVERLFGKAEKNKLGKRFFPDVEWK